ncbi:hypothetical protein [Novosphingobium sp.]|uniref:hypothetical protein n=1 Tax=Novosphingobium sp. TaxID=1874826 RepID=UPI002630B001|nr:hypothetical protein [Novosphingobium sp.]
MNQDLETQLQVVQRALGEVVLPALGNADKHVIEQLHLSLAAIGFMQQRVPLARRYYRGTLERYLAMAGAVAALLDADAESLADQSKQSKAVLDDPAASDADLRAATATLRAGVAALVEAAKDTPHESALDALVMEHCEAILSEDRSWCIPLGFELRPEDLPKPDWQP